MKFSSLFVSFCTAVAVSTVAVPAVAANLTVMPTGLNIAPPKASDTITVRNESREPVKMQVRIFRWEQKNGKDVYYPANNIVVATPPFLNIKGKQDGNIRVSRIAKTPVKGTESYRLILDELPSSRVRANVTGRAASVEVVTRQILPIFFNDRPVLKNNKGQSRVADNLSFTSETARGGFNIIASNASKTALRIGKVSLMAGGKELGESRKVIGNVLPNSKIRFFIPARVGGSPDQIKISEDAGTAGVYQVK